jgi:hypothetical protein
MWGGRLQLDNEITFMNMTYLIAICSFRIVFVPSVLEQIVFKQLSEGCRVSQRLVIIDNAC